MAYNPMLYNPYLQPQPYSWSQQVQQPVNGLVGVTGIEGAKAYQLPPNSSMPLFDSSEDVLYLKTTDAAGYPTIRTFHFTEDEPMQNDKPAVTREEFDDLNDRLNRLAVAIKGKAAEDGE